MTLTPHTPSDRLHLLLPCAGTGSRAGGETPKQYRGLHGQPLLVHTLRAVLGAGPWATVALLISATDRWAVAAVEAAGLQGVSCWPCGGPTRADTVWGGLQVLLKQGVAPEDWVLVHDVARCLVTPAAIERLIQTCRHDPVGGLLALPLPDTLKKEEGGRVASTVDRRALWLAQTPQMFRLGLLRKALQTAVSTAPQSVTDESSAVEVLGLSPQLVMGSADNFKITYPEDFSMAEQVLKAREFSRGAT